MLNGRLKFKTEVLYHAGCRYSYDKELWPVAQAGLKLLQKAELTSVSWEADEACCGGRAYELGYVGEMTKFVEHQSETFRTGWNQDPGHPVCRLLLHLQGAL